MIIQNSNIAMSSNRLYQRRETQSYSGVFVDAPKIKDQDSASTSFTNLLNDISNTNETSRIDEGLSHRDSNKLRLQTINWLLKVLFYRGKAGKITDGEKECQEIMANQPLDKSPRFIQMKHTSYTFEHEECDFNTTGTVTTADGRTIDFGISFSMSRSFESYSETNISQALQLMDPLVINLDGNPTQISDQKFFFDLDCDGNEDELSNIGAGSGFLALDINNDGVINDGSELFGTKSGDGFYDLSKYDLDGNGWIDEADEIFDSLRVLAFNPDGSQSLYSLKESGVGAICLQNVSTSFAYNDDNNNTNALLRSSGVYLRENGTAGTISHIDLAVG